MFFVRSRFLFLFLFLAFACNRTASNRNEIRIGFYGPLTGGTASYGQQVKRGIELALEEAKSNPDYRSHQYALLAEDDRGNPEEAQSAAIKLITKQKVVAILGEVTSSGSLAGAPVCQRYGIPMIAPTATNLKVTQAGDCIFRVCWIDPFQGAIMSKFARNTLHANRVAILYDITSDYSTGLYEVFEKTFTEAGGQITGKFSYNAGDSDFSAQLTSTKSSSPDAIYLPGYYTDVGLILRQARNPGINLPILGDDGWDSPLLKGIAGDALNGNYFCTHFFPGDPSPEVATFVTKFRKKYAEDPPGGSALAYDAANLLLQAIHRSRRITPQDIRDAIANIGDFRGVTGNIRFDAQRNAVKPAVVLRFQNGALQFVERILPG